MAAKSGKPEPGFLSRWSRRKLEQERSAQPATAAAEPEAENRSQALSEEDIVANLPDIETLGSGADFTPFMQIGVPAGLKRLALRKLWASNPLYNRIDMLDDYCEDYTDKATVVEGLKTAYRVGRGMVEKLDDIAGADPQPDIANKTSLEQEDVTEAEGPDGTIPVADPVADDGIRS